MSVISFASVITTTIAIAIVILIVGRLGRWNSTIDVRAVVCVRIGGADILLEDCSRIRGDFESGDSAIGAIEEFQVPDRRTAWSGATQNEVDAVERRIAPFHLLVHDGESTVAVEIELIEIERRSNASPGRGMPL